LWVWLWLELGLSFTLGVFVINRNLTNGNRYDIFVTAAVCCLRKGILQVRDPTRAIKVRAVLVSRGQ
jgi:hypothetical protein